MAAKGIFVFVSVCFITVAFGKPQNQPCVVGGQTIQPGAYFYDGCTRYCRCGSGTLYSCVSVCTPQGYNCFPGTTAQFEDEIIDIGTKLCRCPRFVGCY